jgi:hypothetical protein
MQHSLLLLLVLLMQLLLPRAVLTFYDGKHSVGPCSNHLKAYTSR